MPATWMPENETEQMAEKMESEIKSAWLQGYIQALLEWSQIPPSLCEDFARQTWTENEAKAKKLS